MVDFRISLLETTCEVNGNVKTTISFYIIYVAISVVLFFVAFLADSKLKRNRFTLKFESLIMRYESYITNEGIPIITILHIILVNTKYYVGRRGKMKQIIILHMH